MRMTEQANEVRGGNRNLGDAKAARNDEWYTQLSDIENELQHYEHHFAGKIVLCNCDDPRVSQFFHYFSHKFKSLGLKKLITTCYKNQDADLFSRNKAKRAVYLEYTGGNGERVPSANQIGIKKLRGDGDFRSAECVTLLEEADIVVTNPPFSLFREYVAQLMEHKKKFLIIGNKNSITCKDIFQHIKENRLWLGASSPSKFVRPDGSVSKQVQGLSRWFTNLEYRRWRNDLIPYKKYRASEYPKYDNYDAINVDKTAHIPKDYNGVMGVPISFMDKFNPKHFEIIGNEYDLNISKGRGYINGQRMYSRVFIRRRVA